MFQNGAQPTPINLTTTGGLNLALLPSDIAENELSIAYNMIYDPATGKLTTRQGVRIESANKLTSPIDILHSFVRTNDEGYIVCVSDSILYYLNSGTWVALSTLESSEPTMISFNGKLLIADGHSSGILSWDGTNPVSRITGSPQCNAIYTQANRVIANNISGQAELDAVYMSGVEDETDWDVVAGDALIVRAGYGDGQSVNGFSTIGKILLVSKVAKVDDNISKKRFYGIDMSGDSTSWQADYVSETNAAIGPYALSGMGQDVLYVDTQGIEALTPTQEYGDIATDPIIGGKINNAVLSLANQSDFVKVLTLKNLASTWFLFGTTRIYVYSHLTRAFTEIAFSSSIRHMVEHGDTVYLAGDDGLLFYLTEQSGDETSANVVEDYISATQFKMVTGTGDLLLTKIHSTFEYLQSGTYEIRVSSGEYKDQTLLQSLDFTVASGDEYLHGANDALADAIYDLGSTGTNQRIPCRAKYRGDGIMLQVKTKNFARISIGGVTPIIAQVGR